MWYESGGQRHSNALGNAPQCLCTRVECSIRVDVRDDQPRSQIPVYIWAPEEEGQFQPGRCGRWWLRQSLLALAAELEALGSRLICLSADSCITALQHVIQATGATALFGNRLYDPITMVRDNELLSTLTAMGIRCHLFNADLLYEPWEVMGDDGKPLDTFAAFWQRYG